MKKLAVLGANAPLESFYKQIYGKYYIIGIAWEEGAVCKKYCDKFYAISFSDKERVLDICRSEKIDGITSFSLESALPTVAYVVEELNLTGNSLECVKRTATKFSQRECFKESNIPTPNYYLIQNKEDLKLVGGSFPVIIKPIDSGGSQGVYFCNSMDELFSVYDNSVCFSKCGQVIVEEFIEGREFSVEYISYNGIHYNLQITDKVTSGAPHFVELQHHQPADISLSLAERIKSMTEKALDTLYIKNSASHTEVKLNYRNELYIIEIGARMGGDRITSDLVRLSTGYDFVNGVAKLALGYFEVPRLDNIAFSGIYFYNKLAPFVKLAIFCQYPEIVESKITEMPLEEVTSNFQRNGYLIYRSLTSKLKLEEN